MAPILRIWPRVNAEAATTTRSTPSSAWATALRDSRSPSVISTAGIRDVLACPCGVSGEDAHQGAIGYETSRRETPGLLENVVSIKKGCVTALVGIYPATNLQSPCFFGVVVLSRDLSSGLRLRPFSASSATRSLMAFTDPLIIAVRAKADGSGWMAFAAHG